MPGMAPFNGMRYAHKAIRAEADWLEKAAWEIGSAAEEQTQQFAERFAFFKTILNGHWAGEEQVLFPALEAIVPQVTRPYSLDHKREQEVFASIESLVARLEGAPAGERPDLARRLNRQVIALNTAVTNHSSKEDAHIIPLVEERYSPAEQGRLAGEMVAHLPQEHMGRLIGVVMQALNTDEREDHLRIMLAKMPPQALPGLAQAVKSSLSTADWAGLTERLPELAVAAP